jgi:hypothetical protein
MKTFFNCIQEVYVHHCIWICFQSYLHLLLLNKGFAVSNLYRFQACLSLSIYLLPLILTVWIFTKGYQNWGFDCSLLISRTFRAFLYRACLASYMSNIFLTGQFWLANSSWPYFLPNSGNNILWAPYPLLRLEDWSWRQWVAHSCNWRVLPYFPALLLHLLLGPAVQNILT